MSYYGRTNWPTSIAFKHIYEHDCLNHNIDKKLSELMLMGIDKDTAIHELSKYFQDLVYSWAKDSIEYGGLIKDLLTTSIHEINFYEIAEMALNEYDDLEFDGQPLHLEFIYSGEDNASLGKEEQNNISYNHVANLLEKNVVMDDQYKYLESLDDDDVIEFSPEVVKVGVLKAAFKNTFKEANNTTNNISSQIQNSLTSLSNIKSSSIPDKNILVNGLECRVLKVNKGWKKGKIQITVNVEFYPEEENLILNNE